MDDWDAMLGDVFDRPHQGQSISEMGFHFVEEVGEVAHAIRRLRAAPHLQADEVRRRQENLIEEIADAISWSFSLVQKQNDQFEKSLAYMGSVVQMPTSTAIRMKDVLWQAYKIDGTDAIGCPVCHQVRCEDSCDSAIQL